ncbi:hypothetical protein ACEUZ9_002515 [Paracoccus litorisediminis]|uniref:Glycosyltransferase family 25 (LPS biosynthesis protein) n=1 Tax=Paracoccus litorisediminis TaxID=2006130 RepID=A0A844HJZ5_9RHOB|nr:hypothetical protein [Paracoccus litorisediminis]MTH60503.1 hypothetical protein [Paracoccus litorisediminis]
MSISRISQIYEHEGILGFYSRLRFPKARREGALVGPITQEVQILSPDGQRADVLAQLLDLASRDVVPADQSGLHTRFHLDPDIYSGHRYAPNDVLILTDRTSYHAGQLKVVAEQCHAIIETSEARFRTISEMQVAGGRLFLARADDEGFRQGIYRFLLSSGAIDWDTADWRQLLSDTRSDEVQKFCLSLPETLSRRQSFLAQGLSDFRILDGIRLEQGWIGAALGYRALAEACLARGVQQAIVCEDDVSVAPGFRQRLDTVREYLGRVEWDVFSGLSSHVGPDYRVTRVEHYKGETFVHLDRTTGMVFNIYNRRALAHLAGWRVAEHGAQGITIDRHLEAMPNMRVVTTLPFLVDHSDHLASAAWSFDNRRYRSLISASQHRLTQMLAEFDAGPSLAGSGLTPPAPAGTR